MILCDQVKCSRRSTCLRYRKVPDFDNTTYTDFSNGDPNNCTYYLNSEGMGVKMSSLADADKRNS